MSPPRLKKRFGQNHLIGGHLCRPLIDFLAPDGERVLEIGPGGGVLTAELLAAGARVWACEIDLEWLFHLRHLQPARDRQPGVLELVALDALALDASRLPAPTLITGNLPFNVATAIIESLLGAHGRVPRMAFMVQKEVAERLVARPGERAYASLSAIVASHAETFWLGEVSRRSFRPPPKVAAAFVGFRLVEPPLPAAEMPRLVRLIRQCFAQRRKTLANNLKAAWGRATAEAVLAQLPIEPRSRAEQLPPAAFVDLYRAWTATTSSTL